MTNRLNPIRNAPHVDKTLVLIEKRRLELILGYARDHQLHGEVGGLLIGSRRGAHLHITKVSLPGARDQSTRYSFLRRDWSHQVFATKAWIQSGFTLDWVGEWHTHPQMHPVPSSIDMATWREQVKRRRRAMTYIVIGSANYWVGLLSEDSMVPRTGRIIDDTDSLVLFEFGDYG
jgi:integrative and conjugative element protein (TIGR02256 family)